MKATGKESELKFGYGVVLCLIVSNSELVPNVVGKDAGLLSRTFYQQPLEVIPFHVLGEAK